MQLARVIRFGIVVMAVMGGMMILLIILSAAALLVLPRGGSGGGGQSIDHEPISLEQAHQLIDSGQVYLIAIRKEGNIDEYFPFEEGLTEGRDPSRLWTVDGVDVHIFTESMPTGVPILSSEDRDKVGLTSEQFADLLVRVAQYDEQATKPIDVLDQRPTSTPR